MRLPGKDIPWKTFFKTLRDKLKEDNLSDAAGALTFFGVLAVFPFLLFLVSLASLLIEPAQAEALIAQLSEVAPKEVTAIIGGRLRSLVENRSFGLVSIGAVGAIWAASNGVTAVMRALNLVYGVKETRPKWKVRGLALLFTLGAGALGLLATFATVAAPALAAAIGGPIGTVINWLRVPVSALLVTCVWAVAYSVLPSVRQKFRVITPGSVVGVTIWILASVGFSLYVGSFGTYDVTYGSLGAVIVMLLWMWISSQALLIGAEINAILERWSPHEKESGENSSHRHAFERARGQVVGPRVPTRS